MANTEQITARKIGKNLIDMIDNVKYVKVINDVETLESIQNKIKLFNKVNGKSKKQELIDILSPEKVKEKATKSIIKKIEKTIKEKNVVIKKKSKAVTSEASLADQIKAKIADGSLTSENKAELRRLLKEQMEESKELPKTQEGQNSNGSGRERYR